MAGAVIKRPCRALLHCVAALLHEGRKPDFRCSLDRGPLAGRILHSLRLPLLLYPSAKKLSSEFVNTSSQSEGDFSCPPP